MIKRLFLVSILALVLSCQAAPHGFLTIAGWSPQGEPATYGAEGLWELINGAADTFLDFGFETVTVQKFSAGDVTASIAVYDMGNPLNAFGVYRAEAPVDEPVLADPVHRPGPQRRDAEGQGCHVVHGDRRRDIAGAEFLHRDGLEAEHVGRAVDQLPQALSAIRQPVAARPTCDRQSPYDWHSEQGRK